MGRVTYLLRLLAAIMMAAAFIAGGIAFSDALDELGRPNGQSMLGAMFLAASACFLTAFLSGGVLWVLSELVELVEQQGVSKPVAMSFEPQALAPVATAAIPQRQS